MQTQTAVKSIFTCLNELRAEQNDERRRTFSKTKKKTTNMFRRAAAQNLNADLHCILRAMYAECGVHADLIISNFQLFILVFFFLIFQKFKSEIDLKLSTVRK